MALSRETANALVDVVGADDRCVRQIKSVFAFIPGGHSGATRNFGIAMVNTASMLADDAMKWVIRRDPEFAGSWLGQHLLSRDLTVFDPSDPSIAQYLCTGIADATVAALEPVRGKGGLLNVAGVETVSRLKPYDHTATRIRMTDGTEYVFDWWKTLHPWCPMLYRLHDFQANCNGVLHLHFRGWS